MFKLIVLGGLGAAFLAAPTAFADHWKPKHHPRGEAEYDYATVTHVEPIVRRVRVHTPVRECWEETRYEQAQLYSPRYGTGAHGEADTAARTILGGIIGGVIGHQIGDGRGRDVATAAGAIIGSAVGHQSAVRRAERSGYYRPGYYEETRAYPVERCEVRHETRYEERIEGYDVEYRYNGRTYHTRMPYDPGERLRIRVAVTPTYLR